MKRIGLILLLAASAFGQPKAPSTEIHVLPVQGNIYMLVGAGGNIAASIGPDGILLVDAGTGQMSPKVLSTVLQLVTAVAGYVGLVCGVGLLELIAFGLRSAGAQMPYFMNPEVDFQLAMTAIALLVGVGVLAGLMPALRAAKITPIEAMRAE